MPGFEYPFSIGPFEFPRDEGCHPAFTEEWWYFQSHLQSEDGHPFAFIVSYVNPGYRMSALIDLEDHIYWPFIYPPGFAEVVRSGSRHDLEHGGSWWRQTGEAFGYEMHEKMIDSGRRFGSLDLSMHSEKPPIPVAGGTAKMGRNGWTYWYALTRIGLRGTLTTPDRTVTVHGTGWLDRQWGDWNWMGFGEWKWFAVQLEGGREVVGYHILEPVSGRPISRLCQVVEPDGSYGIWNDLQVEDLGRWTSPESRDVYTVGWQISSSQAGLELEVDPAMVEQEVHRGLWEGSCAVEGTLGGERVSGVSLVELNTGRLGPTPIKLLSYLKAIGMGAKDRIAGRSIP